MQGSEVTTQMKKRYKQIWFESPWYGEGIQTILKDISFEKVLVRLNGSHNVAELVYHMTTWKKYVLRMISERQHSPVPDEENFPKIDAIDVQDWDDLVENLLRTHQRILDALSDENIRFDDPIEGSKFTIGEMIQGVLDHDLYHAGQLRLLANYLDS